MTVDTISDLSFMSRLKHHELLRIDSSKLESEQLLRLNAFGHSFAVHLELSESFISDSFQVTHRENGVARAQPLPDALLKACHFHGKVEPFAASSEESAAN